MPHPHADAIGEAAIEDGLLAFLRYLDAGGDPLAYPWPQPKEPEKASAASGA